MSDLVKAIELACVELKEKYLEPAKKLGYSFTTSYNKTIAERDHKGVVFVTAEYKYILRENPASRENFSRIMPKWVNVDEYKIKVTLQYVALPSAVQKKLNALKKSGQKPVFF